MMIEGSGSGSIPLTNGSGSGMPKNVWIRIRSDPDSDPDPDPFLYSNHFQAFNQKNSLEAHSLKHSGQRPFACSFCAMKFAQRGNLRAHILRVHKLSKEAGQIKGAHCTCLVII